jgi:ribonuclease P protein component
MLTTADGTAPRATVIVNKSVGGAVARNRLRRQVRHGLIRMWDEIPTGARIVVRANAEAQTLAASTLDQSLTAAVHGAGAQAANRTRS